MRLLLVLAAAAFAAPALGQSYLDQVGYTSLVSRLQAANQPVPDGSGVPVAQVEAPVSTNPLTYAPDPSAFIAGYPTSVPGFTITYMTSPPPPPYSGHANLVGNVFYGDGSMTRGVRSVQAWEAGDWFARLLNDGTAQPPVLTNLPKVSNHSYRAELDATFTAADADVLLRRADYLVDRADHVMVVAVGNNGRSNPSQPSPVFGSVYNGITVGVSSGNHESGFTTVGNMGPTGRVKPDLVAPLGTVSEATPAVASAATLLVQVASTAPLNAEPFAAKPQTVKAVLMAGATKAEFPTWSHTATVPLDPVYGAGELNVDNSHRVLTAGRRLAEAAPGADGNRVGWAFETAANATKHYFFEVGPGTQATTLSAVLAWNREFRPGSIDDPALADFDLALKRFDGAAYTQVDATSPSASRVDNVEHLWRDGSLAPLDSGQYEFEVSLINGVPADYALAWRVEVVPVPEPGATGLVVLIGLIGWRLVRGRRKSSGDPASGGR